MKAVADFEVPAPRFVFPRRHGVAGDEQVVQTAWTGQPRAERGVEDTFGGGEPRLGVRERQRLEEALGRDTGPAPEQALKVVRAEAHGGGQRREAGLLRPRRFNGA